MLLMFIKEKRKARDGRLEARMNLYSRVYASREGASTIRSVHRARIGIRVGVNLSRCLAPCARERVVKLRLLYAGVRTNDFVGSIDALLEECKTPQLRMVGRSKIKRTRERSINEGKVI